MAGAEATRRHDQSYTIKVTNDVTPYSNTVGVNERSGSVDIPVPLTQGYRVQVCANYDNGQSGCTPQYTLLVSLPTLTSINYDLAREYLVKWQPPPNLLNVIGYTIELYAATVLPVYLFRGGTELIGILDSLLRPFSQTSPFFLKLSATSNEPVTASANPVRFNTTPPVSGSGQL